MRTIITMALEKELPQSFKSQYPNAWVRMKALMAGAVIHWDQIPFLIVITGVGQSSRDATSG